MMNLSRNTYQSITLYFRENPAICSAYVYTHVESCKLQLHLQVDYRQGKREMARLALRLGKQPKITHYDNCTVYDLHGFLD